MVVIAFMMALSIWGQKRINFWKNGHTVGSYAVESIDSLGFWKPRYYENGHEYINLGLPSGTKWATCNVGANNPEEVGFVYAWGMTESMYPDAGVDYMCTSSAMGTDADPLASYVNNTISISGTNYDVATQTWGLPWMLPTKEQIEELQDNTTWIATEINGISGIELTSKINGNTIFIPTYWLTSNGLTANEAHLMCGTPDAGHPGSVIELVLHTSYGIGINWGGIRPRGVGNSVRPVCQ